MVYLYDEYGLSMNMVYLYDEYGLSMNMVYLYDEYGSGCGGDRSHISQSITTFSVN